jgi:hypothetical protein
METTLRVVLCPHCRRILYALGLDVTREGIKWRVTPDSPPVKANGCGHYVECLHCMEKVTVEQAPPHAGSAWLVAGVGATAH